MKTSQPNLSHLLAAVAHEPSLIEDGDILAVGRHLSGGRILNLYAPGVRPPLDENERAAIAFVDDPDDAGVALVVHMPGADPKVTAAEAEREVSEGRRVALVDLSRPGEDKADPDLLPALTNTSVYVSNLAAYDVNLRRALAAALTPLRVGTAHRDYLVQTMLYYWAWRSIVEDEVRRTFGETVPDRWKLRATTQARSRLGAYLVKLRGRGLRYFIREVGYEDGRVDGFWFDLVADT